MALNLEAVGKKIGPFRRPYDWKDIVLYALGVGAGVEDLGYCYEKNLKVIPTFGAAMTFEIVWRLAALCHLDVAGVLHGEHEMVFYDPTPLDGTLITEGLLTDCYDKGRERGAVVVAELNTRHSNGRKLFTSRATMFARRDGGFGGSDAPKKKSPQFPGRPADAELLAEPPASQPLVYRLSGDTFPLHVDAEFAKSAGFERPIMHGLCTLGFACRALIARLSPGEPEIVRRINCRFKSPLYAGIPIKTLIWELAKGRALWRVVRASDGVVVIDNGLFEIGGAPRA
jgi:acyl dehydratase